MELSATQVVGGALAAGSAAVAASVFGVYGTIIGAVVVSLVTSVGGAIYTHSFRRGQEAITRVRVSRTQRFAAARGDEPTDGDDAGADTTDEKGTTATKDGPATEPVADGPTEDRAPERAGWRRRLAGLNPRTVAITAACVLAVSLGAITGVEALINKPISSALGGGDGGGNSLGRAFQGGGQSGQDDKDEDRSPTPTTTVTTTRSPSGTPTESATTRPPKPTATTSTRTPTSRPTTTRPTLPPTTSTGLPTGATSKSAPENP